MVRWNSKNRNVIVPYLIPSSNEGHSKYWSDINVYNVTDWNRTVCWRSLRVSEKENLQSQRSKFAVCTKLVANKKNIRVLGVG